MSWSSLARATRRATNRNLLLSQFKPLHQNHHPFQQLIYNKRRCEIKKHFSTSYKAGGGSAANSNTSREQKSKKTLIYLTGLVVAMVGSSYAAVPLYRRFCQATGYGGTVQRRESVEEKIARHANDGTVATRCLPFSLLALSCLYREIAVQFNADVGDGMPWKFAPTQREVRVKPGESALAFYTAENQSSTPITGVSTYNVTPMKVLILYALSFKRCSVVAPVVNMFYQKRNAACLYECARIEFVCKLPIGGTSLWLLLLTSIFTFISTLVCNSLQAAVYFNKIQCFCFEEQRLLPGEQIDMPVFFYIDPEFETDPRMDGINNIILSYTFFKVSEE
ncbi:hypothetical protein POTOM_004166 [Populus tomentosa]|uniref:Cytochrome c oxidase assembly protein COX11, mitochondrial n=1 Tax=Populus tomentosa TaxID=118781 RepID=A0A8X8AJR4_POPTO|nr:hypothetical protein POTOM_004166 [Populus tomentosa]